MRVVSADLIRDKKVLLRLDLDVPLENGQILDETRLLAGIPTLDLCLQYASSVIVMGHIGRPDGEDESLSVKPIVEWFEKKFAHVNLPEGKLHILENLRFEKGETEQSLEFARELAKLVDPDLKGDGFYINESFAAHHPAASTTILPTLLPHAAGFQFAKEVHQLTEIRSNPQHPLVAIIGGAKIDDKMPLVEKMSQIADSVLLGGRLPQEIKEKKLELPKNVLIAYMNDSGFDLSDQAISTFNTLILNASQIIWAGPLGKYEEPMYNQGNLKIAQSILDSSAKIIIGGGDTLTALRHKLTAFEAAGDRVFLSTGGGAMLKLLTDGTLPTIEALK